VISLWVISLSRAGAAGWKPQIESEFAAIALARGLPFGVGCVPDLSRILDLNFDPKR